MINSLRFRITAWYLAFFAVLFAGFGVFLYRALARSLERRLDDTLVSHAATAAGLFEDEMRELAGDRLKAAEEAVSEIRQERAIIAIFGEGRLVASSAPLQSGAIQEAAEQAAEARVIGLPHAGPHGSRAAIRQATVDG